MTSTGKQQSLVHICVTHEAALSILCRTAVDYPSTLSTCNAADAIAIMDIVYDTQHG